jgi:RNA polymerase sigma-70 factor, ECF subfamily
VLISAGTNPRPARALASARENEHSPRVADDRELSAVVLAARAGERSAFAVLYDRFHRMVHAVVLSTVGTDEAEDLVQEVFLVALRELATLAEPERFGGWLRAIARRRAIDRLRQRRETDGEVGELARDPAPTSEAMEALRAIRVLPEAYRETLLMRLVEGLTGPEIAELTGMTAESVRVNLCRGMKMLRERLEGGTP